jgi:uncharacterized protein YcfL
MRNPIILISTLALSILGCGRKQQARVATLEVATPSTGPIAPTPASIPAAATTMKLYMDVHHLGAGNVTADAVAEAHRKDLAAQGKHNVKYRNYWFDAKNGTVMCLAEAPSPEAAIAVHKEAHGLLPDSIEEVSEGQ